MEQPRSRGAAADGGGDGPGWSPEPLGSGGPAGGSAAWNGSCTRPPEEDGDDRDRDEIQERDRDRELLCPSPGGARCSCGCPEEPCSAQRRDGTCRHRAAPGLPEEDAEDGGDEGKGTRRARRRQQRHRSAAREREDGGRGAGRRHRPAPRRSHGDGAESPGSRAGSRRPLAAALAQGRRLGAEIGERLLSSCCRLGGDDPGVRSWGRRVGQRARSGSLRAARWLRAGARLFLRLLWMLSALLLLLAVLLLSSLRLCWRAGTAGASRLAGSRWVTGLRGTWGRLGGPPTYRNLWDWVRTGGPGGGMGGGEEVRRLLGMAGVPEEELDPFEVLGTEATASDAELRRAYRRLAVLVHPDKSGEPGAEAAFKVLRAAWDRVSTPERRREHELKRAAEAELRRSVGEFLSRLQEELREAVNTMMCSRCHGKHRRFELERDPGRGRYCGECGGLHPAEEGDLWAESSLLGLKITYLAMMDGKIYDITEWAGCQRVGISPDTHRVPYHLSFGPRASAPPARHRTAPKGVPPSAADLQDFLARLFGGGSSATSGGPFPTPPAPPGTAAPPGGPPRAEGAAPKGDSKHKRRKRARRPLQR